MKLTQAEALELLKDTLLPAYRLERARLDVIDLWYRWEQQDMELPRGATPEHQRLRALAKTPWLNLVVTTVAQNLYVDGYRTPDSNDDMDPWRTWQANDLDSRQLAIHRGALAYGVAYGVGLPGRNPMTGERMAVLRGVSARKMLTWYEDVAEDDWPTVALRVDGTKYRVYDDQAVWHFAASQDPNVAMEFVREDRHDVGVVPVVRYTNMLDLDGRSAGEVEPFIPLAQRINKTSYDRLLTQHFSSWIVRTVTGMSEPDTAEAANRTKLDLAQDRLLVSEDPEVSFGSLPATPLDGFIRAYETDIKTLAAATQTPVHAMVGDLINLSAEALAAARASLDAKVEERQKSFGKSHDQLLRLGSFINGDTSSATDSMAHVTWADTSVRSMATAADALGKIATMLGVPVQALWSMIPGVSKSDVEEWKRLADEGDAFGQLGALLEQQMAPAPPALEVAS